jgi:hypothetical protein
LLTRSELRLYGYTHSYVPSSFPAQQQRLALKPNHGTTIFTVYAIQNQEKGFQETQETLLRNNADDESYGEVNKIIGSRAMGGGAAMEYDRTKNSTCQLHESIVIEWMCKCECQTHRESVMLKINFKMPKLKIP